VGRLRTLRQWLLPVRRHTSVARDGASKPPPVGNLRGPALRSSPATWEAPAISPWRSLSSSSCGGRQAFLPPPRGLLLD